MAFRILLNSNKKTLRKVETKTEISFEISFKDYGVYLSGTVFIPCRLREIKYETFY